jgi:hypothetical protein
LRFVSLTHAHFSVSQFSYFQTWVSSNLNTATVIFANHFIGASTVSGSIVPAKSYTKIIGKQYFLPESFHEVKIDLRYLRIQEYRNNTHAVKTENFLYLELLERERRSGLNALAYFNFQAIYYMKLPSFLRAIRIIFAKFIKSRCWTYISYKISCSLWPNAEINVI